MPTLQPNQNPTSRVDAGNAVIAAAEQVDITPVKKRYTAFATSHKSYEGAQKRVRDAEAKVRAAEQEAGERDADLDEMVDVVAVAAVGDGLPRQNPFKPLKQPSPSAIKDTAQSKEPKVVRGLVAAIRKYKGVSKTTLAAAAQAEKKAQAAEAAQAKVEPLRKALQAAITQRDVLTAPWEKNFAALKRAVRAAEDEGATGLFEALFQRTASAAAPKRPRGKSTPTPVKALPDASGQPATADAAGAAGPPTKARRGRRRPR